MPSRPILTWVWVLLFFVSVFSLFGGNLSAKSVHDSLSLLTEAAKTPSEKYLILEKAFKDTKDARILFAIAEEMLKESRKLKGKMKEAESHERLADLYAKAENYALSVLRWEDARKLWLQIGNRKREGTAVLQTARMELQLKDYAFSAQLGEETIKIFEAIKYKDGLVQVYLLLADLDLAQNRPIKARIPLQKCIQLKNYLFEPQWIAEAYYRWAKTYDEKDNFDRDSIVSSYRTAIRIWEESKSPKDSISNSYKGYNDLGQFYLRVGDKESALQCTNQALERLEKLQDHVLLARQHLLLANIYEARQNPLLAIADAQQAMRYGYQSGDYHSVKEAYKRLYVNYASLNQVPEAYRYLKRFSELNDSLLKADNLKKVQQLKTRYQTDEDLKKIAIGKVSEKLDKAESEKQSTIMKALAGISVILSLLAFTFYQRYRYNKNTRSKLNDQNRQINTQFQNLTEANAQIKINLEEVTQQKELIEKKNREIEAGLQYAYRIQNAILPDKNRFLNTFPSYFVFYQPKDIVSGDFYWLAEGRALRYIAAVDCTGHGVPGAFMSVLAYNLLTEIVNEGDVWKPNDILNELDRRVRQMLHQDEFGFSKDGMDVALCAFSPTEKTVLYSGAHRPLYVVQNGTLVEIKGDQYPVGGAQHQNKDFTLHEIHVRPGDRFYQFSDGVTDQFGGFTEGKKKKFSSAQLQIFIREHQYLKMYEQGETFANQMKTWQGKQKQLDDMLLLGWEVPVV